MTGTGGELSGDKPRRSGSRERWYDKPGRHERDLHDFYIEPPWTVDLLLDAEVFPGPIYDPACGSGTIVKQCRARGMDAYGSDLVSRPFFPAGGVDYTLPGPFIGTARTVMSNPPYGVAELFVRRALEQAEDKVAMLMQAKFLFSERRHRLFAQHPPARVYVLSSRPSMPPGLAYLAGEVAAEGGKMDFVWLVWERGHRWPTECRWLVRATRPQRRKKKPAQSPAPVDGGLL
jgi:hypothetical protein